MSPLWWMLAQISVAGAGNRGVERAVPPPDNLNEAYAPRRVAMVVGIDTYNDPALGDLRYAAKDAQDVGRVLADPSLGAFDLVSEVTGKVTVEGFWSAFRAATAHLHRDDTFVLYIAGHGTLELGADGSELYLLPSEGWLAQASETGIPLNHVYEAVAALPPRRKVTVLDACHAGNGGAGGGVRSALSPETQRQLRGLRGPTPAPAAVDVSRFEARLHAAHFDQPAAEDDNLENGVYTHFLVEALQGSGDADGDGLVEILEAHGFARDRTLEHTGGMQVPWLESRLVGREVLYLTGDPSRRTTAETALLHGLESLPSAARLRVDGQPRGAGPIRPGRRTVQVDLEGQTLLRDQVRVDPGDRLDVHTLVRARQERASVAMAASAVGAPGWLPAGAVGIRARWLPADPGGWRPEFGAAADFGFGSVVALESARTGQLLALAGLQRAPGAWRWGASVGGGMLWRLVDDEAQAAPLAAPSLHVGRQFGRFEARLEPDVLLFSGGGELIAAPRLTLSLQLNLNHPESR